MTATEHLQVKAKGIINEKLKVGESKIKVVESHEPVHIFGVSRVAHKRTIN